MISGVGLGALHQQVGRPRVRIAVLGAFAVAPGNDEGMEALNHDATYLKDHPGAVLRIEGHCDERGTSDYNMVLGDKRAKAARNYLTAAGVSPKQIAIVSYGKERPFCFDRDETCYQQNRRDHMLLSPR